MKRLVSVLISLCLFFSALPFALAQEGTALAVDMSKWQYNAGDGVYWQVGIVYCANPADLMYETLGIFVPEAYMDGVDNGDGTCTCTVNSTGEQNGYTAASAPAGVTDLKAAVRFYRSVAELLPGDSELYAPYLAAIGAVEGYSDAAYGAMCLVPDHQPGHRRRRV